jgi:hypothetical protein
MNEIIVKLFSNEITENGLVELQNKYPTCLKQNMKNDVEFKSARKTRTEMNKLIEKINRRRIDASTELKDFGDNLISKVTDIYNVVVIPFEKEDQFRTEAAAKEKRKLEELLTKERAKIKEITTILDDCQDKTSEHISNMIEAVDLIETDIFHKDVIHEAIETKKETLTSLNQLMFDAKAREKVATGREELLKKEKALGREQEINDRINKLKGQPINYIGKSSKEIEIHISKLRSFFITEEEFGEKKEEAEQASQLVITQLTQMLSQQILVEQLRDTPALQNNNKIKSGTSNYSNNPGINRHTTEQTTEAWLEGYSKANDPAPATDPLIALGAIKEHTLPGDIYEWSQRYEIPLIAHEELIEILRSYKITC